MVFSTWLVGLGAITADAIYMAAVYLGVVHFLEIPFIKAFLWCFGFFVLVYTGLETILSSGKVISSVRTKNESKVKSFMSGFLMSLSNPLTILFWLGIYGSILAKTAAEYDKAHVILYSGAIFTCLLLWDVTMAAVASSFRRFLTGKILAIISVLSGISLIGFGIYFGLQSYKLLF